MPTIELNATLPQNKTNLPLWLVPLAEKRGRNPLSFQSYPTLLLRHIALKIRPSTSILYEAKVKFSLTGLYLKWFTLHSSVFNCEREKGESAYDTAHLGSGIMIEDSLIQPQNESNKLEVTGIQIGIFKFKKTHPSGSAFCKEGKDVKSFVVQCLLMAYTGSQILFTPIWDHWTSVWFKPLILIHSSWVTVMGKVLVLVLGTFQDQLNIGSDFKELTTE